MTKDEAVADFKERILPSVIARYGKKDQCAIDEAWGIYTDALCKSGMITSHQYSNWTNSF